MPTQEAYRIHPVTAEFVDRGVERAFRGYIRENRVRDTRLAISLAAVFYLAFALTDHQALRGQPAYPMVLGARIGVTLFGLLAASQARRYWPWLLNGLIPTLVVVVAMAVFLAITPLLPFEIGWHGMGMMAMLLGTYVFIPNRFLLATGVAVVATLAFLVIGLTSFEMPADFIPTFIALLVVINILGAMVAHRVSRLLHEEYRNAAILQEANEKLEAEVEGRQRLERELLAMVNRDILTGLPNRQHFFQLAERAMVEAYRSGESLSLLLMDIDYFKQLNGTYGHLRGDEVLNALVGACRVHLQEGDILARLGGEEFALILPGRSLDASASLAERLRLEIQRTPVEMEGASLHFTVSMGLARWLPGEPINSLLRRADEAMAAAKYKGRNRLEVDTATLEGGGVSGHNSVTGA